MSSEHLDITEPAGDDFGPPQQGILLAELVPETPEEEAPPRRPGPWRVAIPVFLFVATCASTFVAVAYYHWLYLFEALAHGVVPGEAFFQGLLQVLLTNGYKYAIPVMAILVCHEAGHFLQARRYGVHCSLPLFIPMPISPLGTFGAVIAMEPHMGDRKTLFDIGITGPLAGLVPTIIFCVWGLYWSKLVPIRAGGLHFGDPLIFQWLAGLILGPMPVGFEVEAHPVAFAAWVGLLVTSLNLIPIGQLDGGHILYALLRKKAYPVASVLLWGLGVAVVAAAFVYHYPAWILMLALLMLIGPIHPPTANDDVPLGPARIVLGWLTLGFIVLGLTPTPIIP